MISSRIVMRGGDEIINRRTPVLLDSDDILSGERRWLTMTISSKEAISILLSHGWRIVPGRGKGSHTWLEKDGHHGVAVPYSKE